MKKLLALTALLALSFGVSYAGVRTVVYIQKETVTGQFIFIKGGHDAGLVPGNYPSMSEPITYCNLKNPDSVATKQADASLDWGSESALDWTCNIWPVAWGTKKTYAVDGYGEDTENTMGLHYWKFDATMEGASGEWFEFKSFMRQGTTEWWENNIAQAGTPQVTINHWGKKGYKTVVTYGANTATFTLISQGVNTPPTASFTATPSAGNVTTAFGFDAGGVSDGQDATSALQVRWDWENDGAFDTAYSTVKTASKTYSTIGTKTVKMEVKDSGGLLTSTTKTVEVLNTAPTARITVSPATGTTATSFAFNAGTSSDLETAAASLQVRFDFENDGTYDTAFSTTKTASKTYSTIGDKDCRVEVKDANGAVSTATIGVTVTSGGSGAWPGSYTGKLGANLYTDGTEFSIWARLGTSVQVLVINGASSNYYPMSKITGGANDQVWWAFVPGVAKGREYKYVINNTSFVADPYAKYNRYSGGNSVVVDDTFAWTDTGWARPDWNQYIIYELHVKDFTSAASSGVSAANRGKYLGVIEKLDYITNLGMTAIHIMPPSEFPDAGYSWGYNNVLYGSIESGYAVNPYNAQDGVDQMKTLINEAHKRGVAVIFDMVFNHTGNNDNWLWAIDNVAYFDYSGDGVVQAAPGQPDATPWGNKLNTKHPIVHRLAKDICEYYMKKFHVDGFRFDATHTDFMDHGFITDLKGYVSSIDPKVYMVYENLPNQSDLKTWGGQWVAEFRHRGKDLLCGWNSINLNYFAKHIYYTKDYGCAASPVESMNYLESHDEDTLMHLFVIAGFTAEGAKWKTRLGSVMLATSLGIPMVWMGQEFLRNREGQASAELPLDWTLDTTYRDVRDYYAGVFKLRKNNPSLKLATETGFTFQYAPWNAGADQNCIAYSCWTGNAADKKFVIVLNANSSPRTITVGFPANGTWTEVVTETAVNQTGTISVSGNVASITIQGSSGIIFQQ